MGYQRECTRRLRAGVVGVGSHSYRNLLPVMNYLPVELRAVCDIDIDLVEKTARQYGCAAYTSAPEMYAAEKLDAVFLCVGPRQHPALVLEALAAGVNVWVEKPVATAAAQVEEMIAARGDRIVVVGLKKAFMPAADKAREVIDSAEYGNLRSLLAVYPMTIEPSAHGDREPPNWLRNGVHPLAFLLRMGGPVRQVTAITNGCGHGAVVLGFENGVMGTLHLASGPMPNREYYGLYGDDWSMDIEDCTIRLQRGIPFDYSRTDHYAPAGFDSGALVWSTSNCLATLENKALFTQGFYAETKYFCDCVLEGKPPEKGTLEFALEVMRVYEAGFASKGTTITL